MAIDDLFGRYVNFYTDFAFKKLFGTEANKELLISFLNALLDGKENIKDLTYLNAEQLGMTEYERGVIFDVYCKNEKGEHFIIEIQKAQQQFFKDRSVFYSTFPIRDQAKRGKLCYIYLEMPKFTKTLSELETLFDKWLYAIRHLPDLMERPKELYEAVFERFFEQTEIAKFNRQELQNCEYSLKNFWDWYSIITTAELKGEARGRVEERLKNVRKLKALGVDFSIIAQATGLSVEEIAKL